MDWQVKCDGEENSAWHSHITGSSPVRLNSGSRMYSFFVEMFGMGTGRGMSLVSSRMRGNSPVNGSLLWHFKFFFVVPQWVHVQTIKDVLGSFPREMYSTTPFVTKWCIFLFPFVYFYFEGQPTSCPWCAFCLAAFWDCMLI